MGDNPSQHVVTETSSRARHCPVTRKSSVGSYRPVFCTGTHLPIFHQRLLRTREQVQRRGCCSPRPCSLQPWPTASWNIPTSSIHWCRPICIWQWLLWPSCGASGNVQCEQWRSCRLSSLCRASMGPWRLWARWWNLLPTCHQGSICTLKHAVAADAKARDLDYELCSLNVNRHVQLRKISVATLCVPLAV